jgi:uncharacterized protein (TIGR02996 family)
VTAEEQAFLAALRETPADRTARLVYADWLADRGDPRHELIRACEEMRRLPVSSDRYWQLKAIRNELRQGCTEQWLALTGYDGGDYDPLYRDGVPEDWKGRWRLIREYTERWHGIPMGDVGGRQAEVREAEQRLGRALPPSLREYVAYAHDVAPPGQFGVVHRDYYTMEPLAGQPALSVMALAEGDLSWAIHNDDLGLDDPPVYGYFWADGAGAGARYAPADGDGPESGTLSDFVLGFVGAYKPVSGDFLADVFDRGPLEEKLKAAFRVRLQLPWGTLYEGDGIMAYLYPPSGDDHRPSLRRPARLEVCVHPKGTRASVPAFLWRYARRGNPRGGMFLRERGPRVIRFPVVGVPEDDIPF